MTSRPVLCFGELLIDLIAADGATELEHASTFVARAGGAPANVAVALARLGVPSALCGVIGADPFGCRLREIVRSEGVDDRYLRAVAEIDTTVAFGWKDAKGDGHFRLLRMADRLLTEQDVEQAQIAAAEAIVIGSIALTAEPSRQAIQRAVAIAADERVPVCFDVNIRPSMWSQPREALAICASIFPKTTFLKCSLDDAKFLFGGIDEPLALLNTMAEFGARFCVLTDGPRGAWFATSDDAYRAEYVPAFRVESVEPTGAGDAFSAAVISRLIGSQWQSLSKEDIQYAASAGALTSLRQGAMEALPNADEVRYFLDAHR